MDTLQMMDMSQLIESCIVIGGMGRVLFQVNNKIETDTDIAVLGYLSCSFLLILLHQVAPLFHTNPVQKTEGIYRSCASSGLWCCSVVPTTCVLIHFLTKTGNKVDVDLLCILLTLALTLVHFNPTNTSQITGALILLWFKEVAKQLDGYNLLFCTLYSVSYYSLLCKLPKQFPKSFSYGESTMVIQSIFVFVSKALPLITKINDAKPDDQESYSIMENEMVKISMVSVLCVLLATSLLYVLNRWTCWWKFYLAYGASFCVCVIFGLPKSSIHYSMLILVHLFRENIVRTCLVFWYSTLTFITLLTVGCKGTNTTPLPAARKMFHAVIVAVYIPGLCFDINFLLISSLPAFCIMLIIETLRCMNVPPFGQVFEEKYKLFIDKQDEGPLTLTPIYLMLGLSFPLWISFLYNIPVSHIAVYSGVLSVGIGDAVASIVGGSIGRLKWPGSHKTIEGSLASFASQMVTLYCLHVFCEIQMSWTVHTVLAIAVSTVLEAVTVQIDNLVLPLFLYMLLLVQS